MEIYQLGKMAEREKICFVIGSIIVQCWRDGGRYREATPMGSTVPEMCERLFGKEHLRAAKSEQRSLSLQLP